jgi:hypothetical protein
VLLVPGNHEYDGQDFDAAHARLRQTCDRLGIAWLERESLVLQGVRFVGTTLWSDFDALADHEGTTDLPRRLAQRHKAFRAADFYLRKTGTTRLGVPFMAQEMREQALVCQAWLAEVLAASHTAGPTVVVTHFAPSLRSADPRYGLYPARRVFATHSMHCCPWQTPGCTGTCTPAATTRRKARDPMALHGGAVWWPTRWAMHARESRIPSRPRVA